MAKKTRTSSSRRGSNRRSQTSAVVRARARSASVSVWEDDPGDPATQPALAPITVPSPNMSASPLPFRIRGAKLSPKVYPLGTPGFRYYAAAAALRRTADFWGGLIGASRWQIGAVLPVELDSGVDLNAFYTRGGFGDTPGLHFFHDTVNSRTFFSGESPDVVCHEMGHAVLDAIRPQLWDAGTIEVAAFHESFGDMSALLCALQVDSFRNGIVSETEGRINRSSRLSRLAEQLGAAIRVGHPDAVDPDCLRNAVNSFFYRDPQTLPPSAPASTLSSEPHSFSRVFTAAFLDTLAGIFVAQGSTPDGARLLTATRDSAQLLVAGIAAAPVVPDYFSQVAAHMLDAGEQTPFNGKYRDVIKSAFVRRGILSLHAATTVTSAATPRRRAALTAESVDVPLPLATISAAAYGLSHPVLKVRTPEQPKRFAVTSSSLTLGPVEPRSPQNAAESFIEDLFQRGRVDIREFGHKDTRLLHPLAAKTHLIVRESGALVLKRRTFDCGFEMSRARRDTLGA